MENLAFRPRLGGKRLLPLVLALSGLASYACDGGEEPGDADGIGGQDGTDVIVTTPSGGSGSGGGRSSGGTTSDDKPPFEVCDIGQGDVPEGALLIDDFNDGDDVVDGPGLSGGWYQYDDMTGGSHTRSWDEPDGWASEPGGIDEDGLALHVVGGGYSAWGSGNGFVFVFDPGRNQECLFDASTFDGISFWIKGKVIDEESTAVEADRGVIKVGFQEADVMPLELGGECDPLEGQCYDWHKTRISPTECWRKVSVSFADLEQDRWGLDGGELDLDELLNFNLEIAQGHTYDYWLDDIEFWSGEPPALDEICEDGAGGAGGEGGGGP